MNRLYRESLEAIRRTPGVEAAAVGLHVPYQRWLNEEARVRGNEAATEIASGTSMNYVTPGYFEVLRIPVQSGRVFTDRDTESSMPVAVVNATFVRTFLKGQDPLTGGLIDGGVFILSVSRWRHTATAWSFTHQSDRAGARNVYSRIASHEGRGPDGAHLVLAELGGTCDRRTCGNRPHDRALDSWSGIRNYLVATVHSMTDERDSALRSERINAWMLGVLAALALSLALVGIYGVAANAVAERTREFGIRLALGSSTARVMWDAVAPGMFLSAAGVAIGGLLAAGSVGVLKGLLYGVRPLDLPTFLWMAGVLIGVSSIASLIAAMGVARTWAPSAVLRAE